jgi:hypothetical protein
MYKVRINLFKIVIQKSSDNWIVIKIFLWIGGLLPIEVYPSYRDAVIHIIDITIPMFRTIMPISTTENLNFMTPPP